MWEAANWRPASTKVSSQASITDSEARKRRKREKRKERMIDRGASKFPSPNRLLLENLEGALASQFISHQRKAPCPRGGSTGNP